MTLLLAFAITLTIAVLISSLSERTVLSTTVPFLIAGILLGWGAGDQLNASWVALLRPISQLALYSALFASGMRVGNEPPPPAMRRLVARTLLLGMPLTAAALALFGRFLLHLSWLESCLLGGVCSPTDPVFIESVLAHKGFPSRLRRLLSAEGGLNDGIAAPIVLFLLGEIASRRPPHGQIALSLAAGLAIGAVIPWFCIRLEATRTLHSSGVYQRLYVFAVGVLVLAVAWRFGANIYLAGYAAGVCIGRYGPAVGKAFMEFGEMDVELLKLAAIFVFGLLMAPALRRPLDWRAMVFMGLALVVARVVAIQVALARSGLSPRDKLAVGWLGPKGFSSVVYGLMILDLGTPDSRLMARLVGLTVMLSIVIYSSTDYLGVRWFAVPAPKPEMSGD